MIEPAVIGQRPAEAAEPQAIAEDCIVSFLKFSRDKRGYEHFYLVAADDRPPRQDPPARALLVPHAAQRQESGASRSMPHVMRALEAQISRRPVRLGRRFANTPIPSVEPEHWRERRRAERAARRLQEDEDAGGGGRDAADTRTGSTPSAVAAGSGRADPRPNRGLDAAVEIPNAVDASGTGSTEAGRRRTRVTPSAAAPPRPTPSRLRAARRTSSGADRSRPSSGAAVTRPDHRRPTSD